MIYPMRHDSRRTQTFALFMIYKNNDHNDSLESRTRDTKTRLCLHVSSVAI